MCSQNLGLKDEYNLDRLGGGLERGWEEKDERAEGKNQESNKSELL